MCAMSALTSAPGTSFDTSSTVDGAHFSAEDWKTSHALRRCSGLTAASRTSSSIRFSFLPSLHPANFLVIIAPIPPFVKRQYRVPARYVLSADFYVHCWKRHYRKPKHHILDSIATMGSTQFGADGRLQPSRDMSKAKSRLSQLRSAGLRAAESRCACVPAKRAVHQTKRFTLLLGLFIAFCSVIFWRV